MKNLEQLFMPQRASMYGRFKSEAGLYRVVLVSQGVHDWVFQVVFNLSTVTAPIREAVK